MTSTHPIARIKFADLQEAFEYVNFGQPFEHEAYIDPDTGKIFWVSNMMELEEEAVPEDFETSDRFIAVPHKNDLDLGRRLVMSFAEQELPDDYERVIGYFHNKGAYRRFKDLLELRNKVDAWYAFEERAKEEALREWCADNNVEIVP